MSGMKTFATYCAHSGDFIILHSMIKNHMLSCKIYLGQEVEWNLPVFAAVLLIQWQIWQ